MNDEAGPVAGQDRFKARKSTLKLLEEAGLFDGDEKNTHQVGHHDRCNTVIEPYLSHQWFLKMGEMAARATKAVEDGTVTLTPERWVGVFHNWMGNIRDWCISRQLWWGHRIPVWTCEGCNAEICEIETPTSCPECGAGELKQDADVLDTWFSSWLWSFSPLGWPDATEDMKKYHPTSVLVTGPDIIFFWVARMMMASYHFLDEEPFAEVLFHGIVRDEKGRKMSKSLGNSPDPIELMDKYGADALRMSMIMLTPTGQDVFFGEETLEVGRNFCNKIFQATKLVLGGWDELDLEANASTGGQCDFDAVADNDSDPAAALGELWQQMFGAEAPVEFRADHIELEDRWLMNRMAVIAGDVNSNLEKRRLNDAAYSAYNFFRHELCDWYLESIKPRLRDEDRRAEATCLAVAALGFSYRLLHPVMPFITEELWHALPGVDSYLMTSAFPTADKAPFAADAERFDEVTGIVSVIRSLRSDMNVPPGLRGQAILRCDQDDQAERLGVSAKRIALLAKLENVTVVVGGETPSPAGTGLAGTVEVFLPMAGLVDEAKEKERLAKELAQVEGWIIGSRKKLENENFTARAPEDVVARERDQLGENEAKAEALRARISEFGA